MKKLIALLAAMLMVFAFAACSDDDTGGTTGGGGGTWTPVPLAGYKGMYPAITSTPYPADLKGTTTIADLKTAISDGTATYPVTVKGVITALATFSGAVSLRSWYIQDSTGGVLVYLGADPAFVMDATNQGQIAEMTVTAGTVFSEYPQITGVSAISFSTSISHIYVKEITTANVADAGMVVRYTGTALSNWANSYISVFQGNVPNLYMRYATDRVSFTNTYTPGTVYTVIGPLWGRAVTSYGPYVDMSNWTGAITNWTTVVTP